MQRAFVYLLKGVKFVFRSLQRPIDWFLTWILLYMNGVVFSNFRSIGIPRINISIGGKFYMGPGFIMNNRAYSNLIGRFQPCTFNIGKNGNLVIGENVGISSVSIVCRSSITIGDHVKIGGNVVIYDTDFHSILPKDRLKSNSDKQNALTSPIVIGDNVFIGGHSTILKGVTIGENSVIGAASVVTKDIPQNEVWAGNPAKQVRILK